MIIATFGPVLPLRSDAVASRLANGTTAYISKLSCHWLRDLRQCQISVIIHIPRGCNPIAILRCYKHFSQWEYTFHLKAALPLAKIFGNVSNCCSWWYKQFFLLQMTSFPNDFSWHLIFADWMSTPILWHTLCEKLDDDFASVMRSRHPISNTNYAPDPTVRTHHTRIYNLTDTHLESPPSVVKHLRDSWNACVTGRFWIPTQSTAGEPKGISASI